MRLTEDELGGQVTAHFAAERALGDDRLEGELTNAGRDVAAAALAGDDEAFSNCWALEHKWSMAKKRRKRKRHFHRVNFAGSRALAGENNSVRGQVKPIESGV